MSTAGFNSQNGTGTGQTYANGPSQNPVSPQQLPGVGYGAAHPAPYGPVPGKAPPMPAHPGLYPSGPFQPVTPVGSYQPVAPVGSYQPVAPVGSYQPGPPHASYPAPSGQSLLPRPPMGGPPPRTPPQSNSPGPRPPPAQATPPPPAVSSGGYYATPQHPAAPAWQYNAAMGPPGAGNAPPRGPAPSHANPASNSTGPPPPSSAYSPAPAAPAPHHVSHGGPQMPRSPQHGYAPPGRTPPSGRVASKRRSGEVRHSLGRINNPVTRSFHVSMNQTNDL
ncbi:hypothetical protein EYF80_045393 [Liparis tanakae]|uniref:Uncharacterized protein n=1 Tax=Liparis tanakae TaxID=230148 RepID=A0A4Z2FU50_9TELE|nr:hypothetical protein EYF80_045393 [Liparis tanakae]